MNLKLVSPEINLGTQNIHLEDVKTTNREYLNWRIEKLLGESDKAG